MSELYLVGVDGSDCSRRALHAAARAAKRAGGRLLLAHVIAESPGGDLAPIAPELVFGQQEQELETAHAHLLEPLAAEALDLGDYPPTEVTSLRSAEDLICVRLKSTAGKISNSSFRVRMPGSSGYGSFTEKGSVRRAKIA